jgi:hypothetical protein
MKNTLAENMLRFGVKNLKADDVKKIEEAKLEEDFQDPINPTNIIYALNFKDDASVNKYFQANIGQAPITSTDSNFNAYLPQLSNLVRVAYAFGMPLPDSNTPQGITTLEANIQKYRKQIATWNSTYPKFGVDPDQTLSFILSPKLLQKGGFWMKQNLKDTSKLNYQVYLDWLRFNIMNLKKATTIPNEPKI